MDNGKTEIRVPVAPVESKTERGRRTNTNPMPLKAPISLEQVAEIVVKAGGKLGMPSGLVDTGDWDEFWILCPNGQGVDRMVKLSGKVESTTAVPPATRWVRALAGYRGTPSTPIADSLIAVAESDATQSISWVALYLDSNGDRDFSANERLFEVAFPNEVVSAMCFDGDVLFAACYNPTSNDSRILRLIDSNADSIPDTAATTSFADANTLIGGKGIPKAIQYMKARSVGLYLQY